jgi:hypothetical protein
VRAPRRPAVLCLSLAAACGEQRGPGQDSAAAGDTGRALSSPDTSAATARLERAAQHVVGFLRAEAPFDSLAVADSVELRTAPEGGGARRRVSSEALRDPAAWTVGEGAGRVRLSPPAGYSAMSTAVGRHYRCQAQDLAPVAPEWAERPHVGVRLQPDTAASCLQSWNATFVFDTTGGRPRLSGVLYDQWEW